MLRVGLVILVLAALCGPAWAKPHPGVSYIKMEAAGVPIHLVDVDLRRDDLVVRPVVVPTGHRRSFDQMVANSRPVAAVNGTFFDTATGITVGNLVSDGRLLSEGMTGGSLVIYKDGSTTLLSSSNNLGRYQDWSGVDFAVGGGITLLSNGSYFVDPLSEGFGDPSLFVPRPRTAIGVTENGHLRMVVVTQGATLWQMAHVMKELNCLNAINIDGGSSTGLSVGGTTVVRPQRALTNILGVYASYMAPQLKRAVQVAQSRAQAHYQKGQEYLARGNLRQARSHLRQAVAKAPEQAGYWKAAGLVESRIGNSIRAVKDLHESASLYLRRGDLVAAAGVSKKILELDEKDTTAHLICGECQVEQGLDGEAYEHLKLVLESYPGHPKATRLMEVLDYRRQADKELETSASSIDTVLKGVPRS